MKGKHKKSVFLVCKPGENLFPSIDEMEIKDEGIPNNLALPLCPDCGLTYKNCDCER